MRARLVGRAGSYIPRPFMAVRQMPDLCPTELKPKPLHNGLRHHCVALVVWMALVALPLLLCVAKVPGYGMNSTVNKPPCAILLSTRQRVLLLAHC